MLKMLKSAEATQVNDVSTRPKCYNNCFISFYVQTINQVMKPGAAKAVHSWLQDADDKGELFTAPLHPNFMFANSIIFSMQNVMLLFVYLVLWGVDLQLVE